MDWSVFYHCLIWEAHFRSLAQHDFLKRPCEESKWYSLKPALSGSSGAVDTMTDLLIASSSVSSWKFSQIPRWTFFFFFFPCSYWAFGTVPIKGSYKGLVLFLNSERRTQLASTWIAVSARNGYSFPKPGWAARNSTALFGVSDKWEVCLS